MAQHKVELILLRQLASGLAVPVFIVGPTGDLLYYNEPAELLLGARFNETGELPAQEWETKFRPTDDEGKPVPADRLPLNHVLANQTAAHDRFWIVGLDGVTRQLAVTAFPLIATDHDFMGAVALFWEVGG